MFWRLRRGDANFVEINQLEIVFRVVWIAFNKFKVAGNRWNVMLSGGK